MTTTSETEVGGGRGDVGSATKSNGTKSDGTTGGSTSNGTSNGAMRGGMAHVHLAQFKGAWTAWAGVSLTFVAANFGLALGALMTMTGIQAQADGVLSLEHASAFIFLGVTNVILCAGVSIAVISTSTGLVIASRRGSIARLALAGATPRQVRRTLMLQLTAVTLVAAVIGDLLAVAMLQPFTDREVVERELVGVEVSAAYSPLAILAATGLCVLVALVGGWRQARAASRISPIEALRPVPPAEHRRMPVLRWMGVAVGVGLIALIWVAFGAMAVGLDETAGDTSMLLSLVILIVSCATIAAAAPLTVGVFTRAWTALVPGRSATWHLARSTVIAKGQRLSKSVVPVMFSVSLIFGLTIIVGAITASMQASGYGDFELSAASIYSMLGMIGTPLVVGIAGSVGSLVMMSRQRDAELALSAIAGATPRQRLTIPALEGLIITVSGIILGLVATAVAGAFQYWSIGLLLPHPAVEIAWPVLAGIAVITLTVTMAATVLPTLAAQRTPAPYVVARLVAE